MLALGSIATALKQATRELTPTSGSARLDAELLLADVLGVERAVLYREPQRQLDEGALARYTEVIAKRAQGMPVAYLTGHCEFWSMEFCVSADVLIPRPETELVVQRALELVRPDSDARVVDLGTGSGAIAAAIACERPRLNVTACDRSERAARVARGNFDRLGLAHVGLVVGDWLAPFGARSLTLILANPPYIGAHEMSALGPELSYEPRSALVADNEGLGDLERIIAMAGEVLLPGGYAVVEHGYTQGQAVRTLFTANNFVDVRSSLDLAGLERVTSAQVGR